MKIPAFDFDSVVVDPAPPPRGAFVDPCEKLLLSLAPGQAIKLPKDIARYAASVAKRLLLLVETYPVSETEDYLKTLEPPPSRLKQAEEVLAAWVARPRPERLVGCWHGTAAFLMSSIREETAEPPPFSVRQLGRALVALSSDPMSGVSVEAQRDHGNVYKIELPLEE